MHGQQTTHAQIWSSTPLQTAYAIGAGADRPLGGQHCVGNVEFADRRLDNDAVRDALVVLRRHPNLSCVMPDPNRLKVLDLPIAELRVNDLRASNQGGT